MCLALAVDDIEIRWPNPREMSNEDLMEQAMGLASTMECFWDHPPNYISRLHHLAGLRAVRAEFNRRRAEKSA